MGGIGHWSFSVFPFSEVQGPGVWRGGGGRRCSGGQDRENKSNVRRGGRCIMKKKSLLLAAGMLTTTLAFSQTTQTAGTDQTPHTLLWRISGNGITRPSWLFGTMHILCADDAMLSDSLKAVIAICDEVYFEINLSDMSGMINAFQYMRMNGNEKLSDLLKPRDYARVKDYFMQHVPIPPFSMLERFKPMLLSGMIEEQGLGCETTDGIELQIMKALKQ